jgi:IS30 family transposase
MKTQQQKEKQFIKLYSQTMTSVKELAKRLSVSRLTIHHWRLKHFPDLPPNKRKYKAFEDLNRTGFKVDEIAALLNMTRSSVLRLRRKWIQAKPVFKTPNPPAKKTAPPENSRQMKQKPLNTYTGVFSKN